MANYPLQSYYDAGAIRPADWNENVDLDWGPHKWPAGVPANLMAKVKTRDGTVIMVRREMAALHQLLVDWTEHAMGYGLGANEGGGFTGGYYNRRIGNTNVASAHSRARATDFKAQHNPQSYRFVSTWPPRVIAVWTQCGYYWGGFYRGAPYDTMHLTMNRPLREQADLLAKAQRVISGSGIVVKPPNVTPMVNGGISIPGVTARQVQERLVALGFPLTVDGDFGQATWSAVMAFQRSRGFTPDGWVGPATWAALNVPNVTAPPFPLPAGQVFGRWNEPTRDGVVWARYTRSGDPRFDGPDIRAAIVTLQRRLIMHGIVQGVTDPYGGWADGVYETPTTNAVWLFQKARGLYQDGLVGPTTWAELWR